MGMRKPFEKRTHKKRLESEAKAKHLTDRAIADSKNATKRARHASQREENLKAEHARIVDKREANKKPLSNEEKDFLVKHKNVA